VQQPGNNNECGLCKKIFACLDQEKEMIDLQIAICEHGREVKCSDCVPNLLFPAESDTLGDIACE
jgi:hypothetical protein